ncbi:MAG: peptide chain release factor N(5)-glutamine methyltransferase [Acidimicrobiia bacterium]|nr:peptide chain release factor N(5)-glutamine methyltransferase [Acidimicrobiia bacterium]MXY74173.1 peptide chain release factor N(5)-glutamine methyltransferase [Acidimicrobiia bacterium]MYB78263.1 peptide chain release factor N(5)-glutamine methyltransferase [Acidimicrobiia bacterium]MYD40340.1 peptide chain release factor N(5)-glutamine methyltransferase [Acidimicrobiia bacterium]MYG92073.1 peptide chain release factor N(5)-glutamine methyltransferase [Acidimicrobiia bacterium]
MTNSTPMASLALSPLQISRRSGLPYHEVRRLIETLTEDRVEADRPLPPGVAAATETLIRKRHAGVPLQYLEGYVDFGPIRVSVDERALIPRPETEQLWELVTRLVPASLASVILDIGTGSGALALALAHSYPRAEVIATDISSAALDLARENLSANRWVAGRVHLVEGDLFGAVPSSLRGGVDIVVSNPPYVAEPDWAGLPAEVRAEPYPALVAGPRGTEILVRLAAEVGDWLKPSGTVAVEVGEGQADEVLDAFVAGAVTAKVHRDLAGRSRYVWGGPVES